MCHEAARFHRSHEELGGPRWDRTADLLIANEPEGEFEKVAEGLSEPQTKKDDEDETGGDRLRPGEVVAASKPSIWET